MRIAVVGAGISGLACALRLGQAGHAVRVYERAPTVGGRMTTVEADGFHVDVGTSVLLDNNERTKALCRELGTETEWMPFSTATGGILREGRLSSYDPETVADIARYPGLSPSARARVLRWLLRALPRRGTTDFFDLTVGDDALDTVDAYTATVETCGHEVADWLVDPFVRAFHFHSARRVSMKYFDALATLFLTKEGFVSHGIRGHMHALPRALAAKVPVEHAEVRRVEAGGDGVRVDLGGRTERFDAVVLAVPAHVALDLLATPTEAQARVLGKTRYTSTLVAAYRVPCHIAGDVEGVWVPVKESAIVAGAGNERRKGATNGDRCALTLSLHEEAADRLRDRSDVEVLETVAAEWTRLFPRYAGHLDGLHVQRWNAALPVYGVGHITRVNAFWRAGQGENGVWLCGDYLNHPWVEGSIRCGEKVAAAVTTEGAVARTLATVE